jgi:HNH endonuclease
MININTMEYSENKLREIVMECKTYREVLHKFERNESGASYKTLHRRLKEWNIDTSHFFNKSELMINNKGIYSKILNEELFKINDVSRTTIKRRILEEKLIKYCCKICGQDENWNNKKMSLILDHINGVNNDNRLENLRFLCSNCNATLETHCKGSKGLIPKIKKIKKIFLGLNQRKVKERPSYEQLQEEVNNLGYSGTGRKYGVSDTAIRRWIKLYEKLNKQNIKNVL